MKKKINSEDKVNSMSIKDLLQGTHTFENSARRIRESVEGWYERYEDTDKTEEWIEERIRKSFLYKAMEEFSYLLKLKDNEIFFEILNEQKGEADAHHKC